MSEKTLSFRAQRGNRNYSNCEDVFQAVEIADFISKPDRTSNFTIRQNMKYPILLLFQFCLLLPAAAQKHDYIWVSGDSNTPATTTHGGILIDFNQKPVTATYRYRDMNMFVCNASICDTAGQLIAYSNGCKIARANDEIFENGDNINPGNVHQISCIQNEDGYASGIQSALFLPLPNSDSIYYLFHK